MLCSSFSLTKTFYSHVEHSSTAATLPKMGLAVDHKFLTAQALKPDHSEQRNSTLSQACVRDRYGELCCPGPLWGCPGLDLFKLPSSTHDPLQVALTRLWSGEQRKHIPLAASYLPSYQAFAIFSLRLQVGMELPASTHS